MNRRYIEFYSIMGLLLTAVLVLLVGKYYFGWFSPGESHYARFEQPASVPESSVRRVAEVTTDSQSVALEYETAKPSEAKETINHITKTIVQPVKEIHTTKIIREVCETEVRSPLKSVQPASPEIKQIESESVKPIEVKSPEIKRTVVKTKSSTPVQVSDAIGSIDRKVSFNDRNFHSLGEYVSTDEYEYRKDLIKNLTINTIVIDKLTKGNGISQEFFKVAYQTNMIPAKILADIVESKEFRDLIPEVMLKRETATQLKEGERVVFNGTAIKNLLVLWKEAKLTPVQKIWKVSGGSL